MSGGPQDPLPRGEFEMFRQLLDERLKRTETKMVLFLGATVGLIRFDVPAPVTGAAIAIAVIKGASAFFGGKGL